jgi:hypothetical protein
MLVVLAHCVVQADTSGHSVKDLRCCYKTLRSISSVAAGEVWLQQMWHHSRTFLSEHTDRDQSWVMPRVPIKRPIYCQCWAGLLSLPQELSLIIQSNCCDCLQLPPNMLLVLVHPSCLFLFWPMRDFWFLWMTDNIQELSEAYIAGKPKHSAGWETSEIQRDHTPPWPHWLCKTWWRNCKAHPLKLW